jgi:O-antigen/teichoic acid export membrane protein
MNDAGRGRFVRMFSSAVFSQAVLSAASFIIGLLLIRHTNEMQYGLYVLVTNALLLLVSLQSSFFGPAMVIRMTPLDRQGRGDVVGGLYREQRRLLRPAIWFCLTMVTVMYIAGFVTTPYALLILAAVAAAVAGLKREYFRTALFAHRRSHDVLRGDLYYVVLLVIGASIATLTPVPAAVAIGTMGLAALVAASFLAASLRRNEAWNEQGSPGILGEIAAGAGWATSGAAIHWAFSQGYTFVVAATLNVAAVATIAATRLLLMPINLLSTGISSLMLPTTTGWLRDHPVRTVFARLLAVALAIGCAAFLYIAVMWLARDWIFATVMRKSFEHRDQLLLLWAAVSLVMVLRDQLRYLPLARARFRELTGLTSLSAAASLAATYWGMVHYDVPGALFGVLTGELVSVGGIIWMSLREITHRDVRMPRAQDAPERHGSDATMDQAPSQPSVIGQNP